VRVRVRVVRQWGWWYNVLWRWKRLTGLVCWLIIWQIIETKNWVIGMLNRRSLGCVTFEHCLMALVGTICSGKWSGFFPAFGRTSVLWKRETGYDVNSSEPFKHVHLTSIPVPGTSICKLGTGIKSYLYRRK
jgi:hypothetical protein